MTTAKQWPPAKVFVVVDATCSIVCGGAETQKEARAHARRQREVIPHGCEPCRFGVHEYRLVPKKRAKAKAKRGAKKAGSR
jgi:hypothetical protein